MKQFSLLIIALLFPVIVFGAVSKVVFITPSQTIQPGTLSLPITIQVQDSSSGPVNTTETLDLKFKSTSPTGEFLGSTGKPVSKTMSKGTNKRTFYYRDSKEGNYVITISVTGRTSKFSISSYQDITVSNILPSIIEKVVPVLKTISTKTIVKSKTQNTASATVIYEAPQKKKGFWARLFDFLFGVK